MNIITHRGLDPSIADFPIESTREAFLEHLRRGFGLEFDIRLSKDNVMIAIHDQNLRRISKGKDNRAIADITSVELLSMDLDGAHLITVHDLLEEIDKHTTGGPSAIHLKKASQTREYLDIILEELSKRNIDKYILFDTTIETALYIREKNPKLHIAASVSHPYDIKRYNDVTGGTLYSLDKVIENKHLFDWAWLDEWDLSDEGGGEKKLLTSEAFTRLREVGLKIALITPELHGTSPGLIGGEVHPDAKPFERLAERLAEIVKLGPDAICTDYPDYTRSLCIRL